MYDWILALHIAAWTSWMAGLFYLPRLFVYHAERAAGNAAMAETFSVMQEKLLRLIMNPAMIVTWVTGLWLLWASGAIADGWMHVKLLAIVAMSAFHGLCAKWRKELAAGTSARSGRFFRFANEAPTLLFLVIVVMVIVKPF